MNGGMKIASWQSGETTKREGVRGILNTWFKSYLSGRSQYVSLTQIDKKSEYYINIHLRYE